MPVKILPASLLFAAFAVMPAAAFAQSTPPSSTAPSAATPATASSAQSEQAKLDAHIKSLHDQLQITAAEQPQWQQFADVMRGNFDNMEKAFNARADIATMTAPQNMQNYAQLAQVHADGMQKLASAFQTLYDTFPPSQKKLADAVFADKMMNKKMPHQ